MSVARRKTKDPCQTSRLIGRRCKGRNALSQAVLTVNSLVAPTGPRPPGFLNLTREIPWNQVAGPERHPSIPRPRWPGVACQNLNSASSRASGPPRGLSVTKGPGRHLIPSRTQKLSLGRR
jgi:hypothetical protein